MLVYECIYFEYKVEDGKVIITSINGTNNSWFSIDSFIKAMASRKITKVFMADTQVQFSFLLEYAKSVNKPINKLIRHSGNTYSFILDGIRFVSCDFIYNVPFAALCQEFELGKPGGAAINKLVLAIEDLGEGKFSFIDGDYMTIGSLAWKWLSQGFCGNATDIFGAKYNNHFNMADWEFFKKHRIYRGGLCLINTNYQAKDVEGLYKYDKNSFFLWVMTTGNMPGGRYTQKTGKPSQLADKLIHIRCRSAITRFPGLAAYTLGTAPAQDFFDEDMWIWGNELEELLHWYDMDIEWLGYLEWSWNKPEEEFRKFACHFFPLKSTATGIRRRGVKLIINNSYGKWGENPRRTYFTIKNGEEKETQPFINYRSGVRSLAVASKITSLARTELLRSIREACGGHPEKYFVYGDTDSMILTVPLAANEIGNGLGKFKFEGKWEKGVFLGKKCYLLYDKGKYEAHACGVNRGTLQQAVMGKTWEEARQMFDYDKTFMCPTVVCGKGGNYRVMRPRRLSRGLEASQFNPVYGNYTE